MKTEIYHVYSNGTVGRNFIICEDDYVSAFNRIGICAAFSPVRVLGASVQDTHIHILLKGEYPEVRKFMRRYKDLTTRYISLTRGSRDGVRLVLDASIAGKTDDPSALKRIANYVISQPTKDGRRVLPYYYRWSTASLYFKPGWMPSIWHFDDNQRFVPEVRFGDMSWKDKRSVSHSHYGLPDGWRVCGRTILPENYVDVHAFEEIYGTPNAFTVFMGSTSSQIDLLKTEIAMKRGMAIEDLDARKFCEEMSIKMFGHGTVKELAPEKRLALALALKRKYGLSSRQLATVTRLSLDDIENAR